jgi:hypothetical protein
MKFQKNQIIHTANGRRKGVTHFYDQQFSSFYLPSCSFNILFKLLTKIKY